ncbi:hypothetical protein D9M68_595780 [compost metagenome]
MNENKEKDLESLFSDAKEYVDMRVEYIRLSVIEKASKLFADLITNVVVLVCFVLAFLFGTFTLALFLSSELGSYTKGFGCVALIYLVLAIIVYLAKDKFLEKRLTNLFIRNYFEKVADKEDEDD